MIIKAPQAFSDKDPALFKVFLAGSIEIGKAEDWQSKIESMFGERRDVMLLNPRRDDWDSTWRQTIDDPKFSEQVNWELDAMQSADLIVMYFAADTQSPVTLLEFGLQAASGKLVVCCPEGFWRKGNVDIVAQRLGVEQVSSVDELINTIQSKIEGTII